MQEQKVEFRRGFGIPCRGRVALRFCVLALVFLFANGVSAQPWSPKTGWCAPDSDYKEAFNGQVANLRWSLFALSQIADEVDQGLLTGLTNASVISLANTLSLRSRYLTKCDFGPKDYLQQLKDDERFGLFLVRALSSKHFEKKHPNLSLPEDPVRIVGSGTGKEFPLGRTIKERLQLIQHQGGKFPKNPYFIAASELLGEKPVWEERAVNGVDTIPLNDKNPLSRPVLEDALALIENKDTIFVLKYLRGYYAPTEKLPLGIPESVVRK